VAEHAPKSLAEFVTLFHLSTKADVERHCRDLVVLKQDFVALVMAAQDGALEPYRYANRFLQRMPGHLNPKPTELAALSATKVGAQIEGEARKAMNKIAESFEERRLFAAHLIFTPDHKFWHLLYFDQKDTDDRDNHWREGAHIHYTNDRFHRDPLPKIWSRVSVGDTAFLNRST
jgi:hypothetical protein